MSAAHRRRIDARTHRERMAELSTAERQELHLRGLSIEVSRACDRWLSKRGITAAPFAQCDDSGRTVQRPPAPSCGQHGPIGEAMTPPLPKKAGSASPKTDQGPRSLHVKI